MDVLQDTRVDTLKGKLKNTVLPKDVEVKLSSDLARAELLLKNINYPIEVDKLLSYIDFALVMPWSKVGEDILDLNRAKDVLNKNHYGLENVKIRILEYLSVLILNKRNNQVPNSPVLAFVGLVGSGKTSLAYSIAETLGRPIIRIPFGGLGAALQLRGESRIKPDAEPGLIIKALKRAQVKNPVILLDELDRVTESARNDIMGVLVEILDPEQNMAFLDHYLDLSFDLSQVLFIATANNVSNIATAVLDRLELIEMPFYSDEQKVVIGKEYLFPEALKEVGLDTKIVSVSDDLWPEIVRPLGFDGGIRSLKRNIDTVVRKIAMQVVEGQAGPFNLNRENLGKYLAI